MNVCCMIIELSFYYQDCTNRRLKKIYLKYIMKPFNKNQTVFVFNTFYFEDCSCVNHCSLTLQLLSLCFDKSFI